MKLFIHSIFVLALALSLTACDLKRDSGVWKGVVTVREDYRAPYDCDVEVEITHTDDHLIVHHVSQYCVAYAMKWHVGTFDVNGSSLWRNGQPVGWAYEDGSGGMELRDYQADDRYPMPADTVLLHWNREREGLEFTQEVKFLGMTRRSQGWLQRVR